MSTKWAHTCWRDMHVDHPADWELVLASGPGQDGRLKFADRIHERLDVRWRGVTYVPNLDKALEKYQQRGDSNVQILPLERPSSDWTGLVRQLETGAVAHAGRFFREQRVLTEVTMVWPGEINAEAQARVLASVGLAGGDEPVRLWQASGLHVELGRAYELCVSEARVGRVAWTFRPPGRTPEELTVARLAMPEYWLTDALRDWLAAQLPDGHEVLRTSVTESLTHRAECLLSRRRRGRMAALRGLYEWRLSTGWFCPREGRVYHVTRTIVSRDEEIALPRTLRVHCCQAPPAVAPREDTQP